MSTKKVGGRGTTVDHCTAVRWGGFRCDRCGKVYPTLRGMAKHLWHVHTVSGKANRKVLKEKFVAQGISASDKARRRIRPCRFCGKKMKAASLGGHTVWCKKNPSHQDRRSLQSRLMHRRKHTQATKDKLSACRTKTMKRKGKSNHNWSVYRNQETRPEAAFRILLAEFGVEAKQYYHPPESERAYELDFAIPRKKIAFEVNGNQHYTKARRLKAYYQRRHDYLASLGWTVYEIPFKDVYDRPKMQALVESAISPRQK